MVNYTKVKTKQDKGQNSSKSVLTKPEKIFFRVGHIETKQGLWYDQEGDFTGLIHTKSLSFCKNKDLQMPFDENIRGFLSATATLEELYFWFTESDIKQLKQFGFRVMKYSSENYFYKDNHWLIDPNSTILEVME